GEVEVQTGGAQIDALHVAAVADTGSANALVGDIATIEERAHDLTADSANAGSLIVCDLVEADAALTFQLTPLDAELRGVNQYQGAGVVVGTAIHRLPMLSVKAGLRLELAVIAAVHARQHAHMNRASQRHEVGQQTGYTTDGQHQLSGLAVDLGPQARVHLGGVGGGAHQPVNHHLVAGVGVESEVADLGVLPGHHCVNSEVLLVYSQHVRASLDLYRDELIQHGRAGYQIHAQRAVTRIMHIGVDATGRVLAVSGGCSSKAAIGVDGQRHAVNQGQSRYGAHGVQVAGTRDVCADAGFCAVVIVVDTAVQRLTHDVEEVADAVYALDERGLVSSVH